MRRPSKMLGVCMLASVVACGVPRAGLAGDPEDGGLSDAVDPLDAAPDALMDAAPDVWVDVGTDALMDVGTDVSVDVGVDGGPRALCNVDEYVMSLVCVDCDPGSVNDSGDDPSGTDTSCDAILCGWDENVVSNSCEPCVGGTNDSGDDASGTDTSCDPCAVDGRLLLGVVVMGDTSMGDRTFNPSCDRGGSSALDDVYIFTAPDNGNYRFTANPSGGLDIVLSLRDGVCPAASEQRCRDDSFGTENLDRMLDAGQSVGVAVHGFDDDGGAYSLSVALR